jgi:hypothetical protein
MNAREIYKKETDLNAYDIMAFNDDVEQPTLEYLEWLEKMVEQRYEPTILKWIKKMFAHAEQKQWFETYWSFDIHGTISKPDYRKDTKEIIYYPYAKETLQLMSERKDIVMILWSSSYPEEMKIYKETFKNDNIIFNYDGENPEVSSSKGSFGYYEKKHYFNVLFDDKCGFNPDRDWKFLYNYFKQTEYKPNPNWSMKYKEDYHK